MRHYDPRQTRSLYRLAALLGILGIVVYLGYNFADTRDYWLNGKVQSSLNLSALWGQKPLLFGILGYAGAVLLVYLLTPLLVCYLTIRAARLVRVADSSLKGVVVLSLLMFLIWTSMLNALWYPQSNFAPGYRFLFYGPVGPALVWILGVGFACLAIGGVLVAARDLLLSVRATRPAARGSMVAATLVIAALSTAFAFRGPVDATRVDPVRQPDVLLVGIDSLRPDHLSTNGYPVSVTPALDNFLSEAVVFDQALTPLARTYPAWLSILTGREPVRHGGRFNLLSPEHTADAAGDNLAVWLAELGYETVYATDEKRFSNIDESFGFETLVGPSFGAADFIIGAINDLPLTNLVSNTTLGRYVFPYTYANRAHTRTYRPDSFNRLVSDFLARRDPGRPLFMATHLCLPHWPFKWAGMTSVERNTPDWPPPPPYSDTKPFYLNAVEQADRQFERLIDSFRENGLLDNTLVFVLSDHGESFSMAKDNLHPGYEAREGQYWAEIAGHGTSVNSASQHSVLLALRAFGREDFAAGRVEPLVSLTDIAPSVLDFVGEPAGSRSVDGLSVLGLASRRADSSAAVFESRVLTVESGFSVPAMMRLIPDVNETIRATAQFYEVDSRGRLVIRPRFVEELLRDKERAVIRGDWRLSVKHVENGRYNRMLTNRREKRYWHEQWLDEARAPVEELTRELCQRFRPDPHFAASALCMGTGEHIARSP